MTLETFAILNNVAAFFWAVGGVCILVAISRARRKPKLDRVVLPPTSQQTYIHPEGSASRALEVIQQIAVDDSEWYVVKEIEDE
jgi:hypothetical protein